MLPYDRKIQKFQPASDQKQSKGIQKAVWFFGEELDGEIDSKNVIFIKVNGFSTKNFTQFLRRLQMYK